MKHCSSIDTDDILFKIVSEADTSVMPIVASVQSSRIISAASRPVINTGFLIVSADGCRRLISFLTSLGGTVF